MPHQNLTATCSSTCLVDLCIQGIQEYNLLSDKVKQLEKFFVDLSNLLDSNNVSAVDINSLKLKMHELGLHQDSSENKDIVAMLNEVMLLLCKLQGNNLPHT